jgi:hypothetical protein
LLISFVNSLFIASNNNPGNINNKEILDRDCPLCGKIESTLIWLLGACCECLRQEKYPLTSKCNLVREKDNSSLPCKVCNPKDGDDKSN